MLLHSYLLLPSCVPFVSVLRFVRAGLCLFVGNYCNGIWYTTPALSSLGMVSLGELYMSYLRVLMGWKLLLYLFGGGGRIHLIASGVFT